MDAVLMKVFDEAPDAILVADCDGNITYWNGGAERMFGYLASEALGRSLDLIIPDSLRSKHWEGYHRVMASGETKYKTGLLTSPGIRKDGSRVSLEFSMVLVKDDNGLMTGCAAIMRDVTERWQKERELKQRLAECEAGKPA